MRVDYYRGLEAGRKPGPELLAAFEAMYGPVPPEPPREQPDNGDMAAAIRELVEEVRLSRLASDRNADVLAQLLGVVLSGRLPQPETEAADAPLVRQGNG